MTYDLSKLNELSGGDDDFNASIIEAFLAETPSDQEALRTAVEAGNFDLIYQSAHKIKPNADLLGIDLVRETMLNIEGETKSGRDLEKIRQWYQLADVELKKAFSFFESYIAG